MAFDSTMITELELADRWDVSRHTLRRWRAERRGPIYVRLGGRHIRYLVSDVEAFELESRGVAA